MPVYPFLPRLSFVFLSALVFSGVHVSADVEVFTGQPTNANQEYLLAAWNFNNAETLADQFEVSHGAGSLTTDWDPGTFSNFAGTSVNAFSGDAAGRDLGLRNGGDLLNEGRQLTFWVPFDGFRDLEISYATRRSASGFTEQHWSWSLDGEHFVFHETVFPTENYELRTVDFAAVGELENAVGVYLRITFRGVPENPSATGNNRIDNIRFQARATEGTAGPGTVTIRNATGGSPYAGTDVFMPGEAQTVEISIFAAGSENIGSVAIPRPAGWSEWNADGIELLGDGFSVAELSVENDRIEIVNSEITENASGMIRIRDWMTPDLAALGDRGESAFDIETAAAGETSAPVSPRPEATFVIPIDRLRAAVGRRVAVSGVATVGSGVLSALEFFVFVQDETAGVALYAESISDIWKPVFAGNGYTVVGIVEIHRGMTRLRLTDASDLFDLGPGEMPEAKIRSIEQLLANPEHFEGMLVRIPHVSKSAESEGWPEPGLSGTITISDDGGANVLDVFLNRFTDVAYQPEPDFPADFVGIFGRFNSSGNTENGYELLPRSRADILPPTETATGFEAWQREFFEDGEFSEAESDPDGDGVINLLEYAFGGNPREPSRAILPRVSVVDGSAALTFRRVRAAADLVYEVEASEDLAVWETIWNSEDFPFEGNEAVAEVRVTDEGESAISARRFLRVRVSRTGFLSTNGHE